MKDKKEKIEEKEAAEITVEVTEEIRPHVGELLIYMDDERRDYECMLEDNPKGAKDHVWLHIKAIGDWIGLTSDDARRIYQR